MSTRSLSRRRVLSGAAGALVLALAAVTTVAASDPLPPPPPPPPPLDTTAPAVTAPHAALVAGGTLTTSVPVRVTWAIDDDSPIQTSQLRRLTYPGGSASGVALASPTATVAATRVPLATSVAFGARATDIFFNTSGWSQGSAFSVRKAEQDATGISYHGSWSTTARPSASGGSLRHASSAGASVSYRFTGRSVAIVAERGPSYGTARVYLDGSFVGSVSLARSTAVARQIVFARNVTPGTHVLRIVRVTKAINADAFLRIP